MFEFLPQNMQGAFADFGNVKKMKNDKIFKGINTVTRNVCAHNERCFLSTYIDIPDTLLHEKLSISKNGSKIHMPEKNIILFGMIITFRYLLPKTDFTV